MHAENLYSLPVGWERQIERRKDQSGKKKGCFSLPPPLVPLDSPISVLHIRSSQRARRASFTRVSKYDRVTQYKYMY